MVDANVVIINELKAFLEDINMDSSKRQVYTFKESNFSRERVLTLKRIVGILLNMPKRSLSIEVREFLAGILVEEKVTKSALKSGMPRLRYTPLDGSLLEYSSVRTP